MAVDEPPTRAEMLDIERRLRAVEDVLRPRSMTCASCGLVVPLGRFCSACGAPAAPPPVPRAPVAPRPPSAPPAPIAPPVVPAKRQSVEAMLGQRFAPRLGAMLVFLGVLFFLGVAIQRGWIGPLGQLSLATIAGVALVTFGAILTARRGYGTYPQVIEATGACVLYLTAFVAHALPYYRAETALTELGSGVLMALVALGTVGLALWRDARVIASLGYGLAFLTALLGLDVLPGVTLAYVALLGTSLAVLVARKGWLIEGLLGSLATGSLLLALSFSGALGGGPDPALVALVALAPAAAFLWLGARPVADERLAQLPAMLVLATFAWGAAVCVAAAEDEPMRGAILLASAVVGVGHLALSHRLGAPSSARLAAGIAAIALYLIGAPLAWSRWTEAPLLTTSTYAAAALALAAFAPRARGAGAWIASLVLAGAAALHALAAHDALNAPWTPAEDAVGSWRSWITLLVVFAPVALVGASRVAPRSARAAAYGLAAAFGAIWTFALFGAPILATAWLLALAAALLALGVRADERPTAHVALAAALAILTVAALKAATFDTWVPDVRLPALTGAFQATAIAAALLGMHQLARARALVPTQGNAPMAIALVGGSALVLANAILAYADDPWPSILLGALGVLYLAAGFARRHEPLYRYTGFAILGFVVLRVFLFDMRETDLALRALVFAVLGAILLGVGYAYARVARKERAP